VNKSRHPHASFEELCLPTPERRTRPSLSSLQQKHPFCQQFLMFVPSLSWQMIVITENMAPKKTVSVPVHRCRLCRRSQSSHSQLVRL